MPIPPDWSKKLQSVLADWKQRPNEERYWGDGPFDSFVLVERASSWSDFLVWLSELDGPWCFRGQREASWLLHTSLDRAVLRKYSRTRGNIHVSGYDHLDRETEGRDLLFRFQQQAHHYLLHTPARDDLSSWFALMQHHGVPTRFLDWTLSPYVGMYFALEEESQGENKCSAVWAIDLQWLENRGQELLQEKGVAEFPTDACLRAEYINSLLSQSKDGEAAIIKVEPLETAERMSAQQGFFLCKLFHIASFNQTLMRMMIKPEAVERPVVRKLEIEGAHRIEFLQNLRAMNIHRASLFPGIDGFGYSLKLDLEIKVKGEVEPRTLTAKTQARNVGGSMTTYILGAGASRHAGYPLTYELGLLLREWAIRTNSTWSGFIQEAFELYGGLENLERVLTDLYERPEGSPASKLSRMHCGNMIGAFNVAIPELFNELGQNASTSHDLYAALATRIQPGDAVVTFNYDLACERALRNAGLWEVSDGYGFDLGLESIPRSKVKLLKLHGSTNWMGVLFGGNTGFSQASSVYDKRPAVFGKRNFTFLGYRDDIRDPLTATLTSTPGNPALILPTLHKTFFHQTTFGREWERFWDEIWQQAGEALHASTKVVIVGYSMPVADERARDLILKCTNPKAQVAVFSGSASKSICQDFQSRGHKTATSEGRRHFEDFF